MRALILMLLTLSIGVGLGWIFSQRQQAEGRSRTKASAEAGEFRCSMHPWIRAKQPEQCTICGMGMTLASTSGDASTLRLGTNMIRTMGVTLTPVVRKNLTRNLLVAGRITAADTRRKRLAAYVPGRIEELHVNFEGAEVSRGEPLITIYSPLLLEAEREYRLLYRQSQMNHSTKITAEHGRLLAAMKQRLTQYGLSAAQIAKLPTKSDELTSSEILAPIDGVVTKQLAVEGQYVEEGELMLELADLYTMWFQFDVYESDLPHIKTGQRIEIQAPGSGKPSTSSTISFINPNLNLTRRAAEVRAELRNPIIRIKGEKTRSFQLQMYAEGQIVLEKASVLAVPRSAVLDGGMERKVFVESSPGVFEARAVELGFRGDDQWEIISGVREGERVAANGLALLDSQTKL